VLLKGGHLGGAESVDVLVTATGVVKTRRPRIDTTATHGTGCALSSAIAALAARTRLAAPGAAPDWAPLVQGARDYLHSALVAGEALGVGGGHGPVHHFAGWWPA
jgi:hydroxymethylpyrimidine/phosphomethylpyrimidine kinase